MAYLRFAAWYGHPLKLLPDKGSQLLKACKEMQYSWIDVKKTLNQEFHVGFDFDAAPVGQHNQHGAVEHSIREIRKLFDVIFLSPKYKMDILSFESVFCYVSNELNNLPICLGANFKDLSELDKLTPNPVRPEQSAFYVRAVHCWFKKSHARSNWVCFPGVVGGLEHTSLADFVLKPPKWFRSSPNLEVGDIVIFTKDVHEQKLGEVVWTVGRLVEAVPSRLDGKVRQVKIEYKNAFEFKHNKAPTRTTNRAARSVARLAKEGVWCRNWRQPPAWRGREKITLAPHWYRQWEKKPLPILMPAGLGRVNALFQLNPDPYATFCESMKILGFEMFYAAQSKD
jgi:hypothetical protein